jgi:hypothetical protein
MMMTVKMAIVLITTILMIRIIAVLAMIVMTVMMMAKKMMKVAKSTGEMMVNDCNVIISKISYSRDMLKNRISSIRARTSIRSYDYLTLTVKLSSRQALNVN